MTDRMECATAPDHSDATLLRELVGALTVPSTRSASIHSVQGLLGQVFNWGSGEAQQNMQLMFPSYTTQQTAQLQHQQNLTQLQPAVGPSATVMQSGVPPLMFAAQTSQQHLKHDPEQLPALYARPIPFATATAAATDVVSTSTAAPLTSIAEPAKGYTAAASAAANSDWQQVLSQQQHQLILQQQQMLLQQQMLRQQQQQQQQQQSLLHESHRSESHENHLQQQQQQAAADRRAAAAAKATFAEISDGMDAVEYDGSSSSSGWDDGHQRKQRQLKRQWQQEQRRQQQQHGKRRGRPTKKPGQYSKGYIAIKRYRQRKQGLVGQLEDAVAAKREEYLQLQAEQELLTQKQQALEAAVSLHKDLFESFTALRISLQGEDDQQCTAAAAEVSLHDSSSSSSTDSVEAAQPAAAASPQQQQQQQQQGALDVPVMWARYRAYIRQASEQIVAAESARGISHLADRTSNLGPASKAVERQQQQQQQQSDLQEQQQQPYDSSNPQDISFPPFPFSLVECLALFKFSRFSGTMPDTNKISETAAAAATRAAPGAAAAAAVRETVEPVLLNLSTGEHDVPSNKNLWVDIAKGIELDSDQKQRLRALFTLYTAAVGRLNMERQQLQQDLQQRLEAESALAFDIGSSSSSGGSKGLAGGAAGRPAASVVRSNSLSSALSTTAAAAAAAANTSHHSGGPSSAAAAAAKGSSLVSAIDDLQQYQDLADNIEWNLIRGRAMIMLYGWAGLELLTAEQKARMCVASWPYFPLVRAIFGHLLAGEMPLDSLRLLPATAAAAPSTQQLHANWPAGSA